MSNLPLGVDFLTDQVRGDAKCRKIRVWGEQPGMNQSMGLILSPLKSEDRRDLDGRNEKNTGKKVFFPHAGDDE
jgi:hypothetical protein